MGESDKGYKLLFSHAQMVEELLRDFVREDWVGRLDFSTLEKYNSSFVSDDLKERFDDVIWSVRWGRKQLYIYILLEFQSEEDYFMSVRIMTYLGLLYQDLIRTKKIKEGGLLPPVLPIVLYNGERRWLKAPLDINDLIGPSPRGLEHYLPRLRYLLIDEMKYADEELSSINSLVASLFRLERQQTPEKIREILKLLIDWLKEPGQQSIRRAFTVWLGRLILPNRYPNSPVPEFNDLQEVNTMLAETIKNWYIQWKEEGLKEGIKEGMEKKQAEAAINMHQKGFPTETIAEILDITVEKTEEIIARNKVSEKSAKYSPASRPEKKKLTKTRK
ncbi:MAG: Rpn family recombination-promoting nuclease/putative transposase [Candidatus Riflebacteria bacterium]